MTPKPWRLSDKAIFYSFTHLYIIYKYILHPFANSVAKCLALRSPYTLKMPFTLSPEAAFAMQHKNFAHEKLLFPERYAANAAEFIFQ